MSSAVQDARAERPQDKVYTVAEIAAEWKLSVDTIQRMFAEEPGVFVWPPKSRKRLLRIPADAKQRVWQRNTNKWRN
jgi:hypothetical protein